MKPVATLTGSLGAARVGGGAWARRDWAARRSRAGRTTRRGMAVDSRPSDILTPHMAHSRHRRRHRLFRPILRPFPGHKLPPDLRVGGVEKIACALPEGLADPGFEVLLRRIDGAPFFGGNRVDVFFNGRDAFGAMRESGEAAQEEIL